ncbi:MAG TPA: acetyl-CoA decarbonylase/synthase complex subunit gamma [bacterium]|nr:acetyl-CoA decarbonylase/synthase complex subunit gamma [bacterium]
MALTGIEIFKQLPKTNCKDCGFPTCLAFAMNLAAGKGELADCPHVSDAAKETLSAASAPPIRPVKIGAGDYVVTVGGETVEFRHEKTFVNPTPIAVMVSTDMSDADVEAKIKMLDTLVFDRVGLKLKPEMVAVKDAGGDAAKFSALVSKILSIKACPLILVSSSADSLKAGAEACGDNKPLLHAATAENADAVAAIAKEKGCPVVAKADSLDALAQLTEKLSAAGLKDIVLDTGATDIKKAFEEQIIIRRAALRKLFRPLGFPTITFPCEMFDDPMMETLAAATMIAKYSGIVVLSDLKGETVFPLLLQRMNIFTDPQRPMATEQGIYPIGNPDENSPVLITTNFSLTYFIVAGEIEASRVPSWLLIIDSEGLSVLTAWAAGKFVADAIAPFVKKSGIEDKIKHRKIVIPGYAAQISGELEEELAGWEIQIGPREASHLSAFLKNWSAA